MEMRFWEENSLQHVKFESNSNDNIPPRQREPFYCEAANLNFATGEDDCVDYAHNSYRRGAVRVSRQDPLSHRIIEKRRRDRMNNCLADLSRLIPAEYLKKGRGRVEKTEIIEMAIKHMKCLQYMNNYRLGFQECMSEALRFLVDVEGRYPREPVCVRLLGHLQAHCDNVCRAAGEGAPIDVGGAGAQGCVAPPGVQKLEPNNNYDGEQPQEVCAHAAKGFALVEDLRHCREDGDAELDVDMDAAGEKREEHHAAYKYKNDIKLRFTQDNAKHPNPKLADRRNSTPISTDHTCSSIGSPTPVHFIEGASVKCPSPQHVHQSDAALASLAAPTPAPANPPLFSLASLRNGASAFSKPTPTAHVANGVTCAAAGALPPALTNGMANGHHEHAKPFLVPAFILHAKGAFYLPVTLDYNSLLPYLNGHDLLGPAQDVILHPVAINVNFQQQALNLQQPKTPKCEKLPAGYKRIAF